MNVVPGKQVGPIEVGATRAEAVAAMGERPHFQTTTDTLTRDAWMLPGGQRLTVLFHDDRVLQIRAEGPGISTADGISTKSTQAGIRRAFPNTKMTVRLHDVESIYLDDIEQGIGFVAREAMENEPSNPDGEVISIYVHEPGREIIPPAHGHH